MSSHTFSSICEAIKRTEPSAKTQFAPPTGRLDAGYKPCPLLNEISFEQSGMLEFGGTRCKYYVCDQPQYSRV